jgi:uncharacterized membrane protein
MTLPAKILIAVALFLSIFATGFGAGVWVRTSIEAKAQQAAMRGAAEAIKQIQITNTTIQNKTREIITKETVYTECRQTHEMMEQIKKAYE